MKKIVFIINTIPNQRCIKRVNEFISNGYQVDAFSFVREGMPYKQPQAFSIEIIGSINNDSGYTSRIKIIKKGIKKVSKRYKGQNNVMFYYFGLDIAIFGNLLIRRKYFYEESDLAQTYISKKFVKKLMDWLDKKVILYSEETILTSGGFLKYHFGNKIPKNVSVIPNKVNIECLQLENKKSKEINLKKLKIGFVGLIRYDSILNFANVFANKFPDCEFHFFGNLINENIDVRHLKHRENIFFHGEFQNPTDLPSIYQTIDLVLSTYDTHIENVLYAEPNKVYEAIFYKTPIIVSRGTFLSDKVESLQIGYSIDAMNEEDIINFVSDLTVKDIESKIENCENLPLLYSVNENSEFFNKIKSKTSY